MDELDKQLCPFKHIKSGDWFSLPKSMCLCHPLGGKEKTNV